MHSMGESLFLQVDLADTMKAQAFCCISKVNLKGQVPPIECMTAPIKTVG